MKKNAEVMLCKCQKTGKTFGIRVEKIDSNNWLQNWAFPINDKSAKNEGYGSTKIVGQINWAEDYPGCPYCGAMGWVHCCDCGKLTDNPGSDYFKCGWCKSEGIINGIYEGEGIDGAGDR